MKSILFVLILALTAAKSVAQENRTAYNFLRLPVSAHVAALGGENITLAEDDATMLFHNPALINEVTDKTLNLNYMNYMEGCHMGSASFVKAAGDRATWAAGGQFLSYGTMRQTDNTGEQTGEFSAKDIAVSGAFAYALTNRLTGGITAKAVMSYIGPYSSLAMGVDLGLNYYDAEREWSVSAVARNLGGQLSAYEDDFERMPLDLQLGVSKRLIGSQLRLSLTLVRLNDWSEKLIRHVVVGADLLLGSQFYVSAGYNAMRASQMKISEDEGSSAHGAGLSIGGGMMLERFKLSVAYAKYHVSAASLLVNVSYTL